MPPKKRKHLNLDLLSESPRTALLSISLKVKCDNLSTAGLENGIWVNMCGCFVVVVLPD
jgi:hypothetical protein